MLSGARIVLTLLVVAAAAGREGLATADPRPGIDWPSFRGIRAIGVADGYPIPTVWNVPTGEGVRWKVSVEGLGHSSPVVWGDRVCLTTALSGKSDASLNLSLGASLRSVDDDTVHTWKLICVDKRTGRTTLNVTMHLGVPKVGRHARSTHANSTLATDGTRLVAMLGSEGLHAYDFKGKLLWRKDLGRIDSGYYVDPTSQWAFGSSPVIEDGLVVVQADAQENGFIAAFDLRTGRELWRTNRDDVPTWGSPTIYRSGDRIGIAVNGLRHIGGYDVRTGAEIWQSKGVGDIPVPTPVVADGLIYITNAHGNGSTVFAVRDTARGQVTLDVSDGSNEHLAWSVPRHGAYIPTPVLYRGMLYLVRGSSPFLALDAKTGSRVYQKRLGGDATDVTASLVAGDGKVFVTSEDGEVFVVKAGPTFEVLATNVLGEPALATPAISEGVLYFRTVKSLVAIGH